VIRTSSDFQVQNIANTAWAFANSDCLHRPGMDALSAAALRRIQETNPQAIANMAWSWARLLLYDLPLFDSLAS